MESADDANAAALRLHVHPQTIRYRLRQVGALFGDALTAVGGRGVAHELVFGAAVAVILAWTVVALALAGWIDSRRDIA